MGDNIKNQFVGSTLNNPVFNYGEKEIPKYLTNKPFPPELFLGREDDIETVHEKLFSGQNLLLLVNGNGGIGKTTFAAQYYYQYHEDYTHLAWVFAEKNLLEALLVLAAPNALNLTFDDKMPNEARLQALLKAMGELDKPCLLVVDNANELAELEKHHLALKSCPNFHVLLTTRVTKLSQAAMHPLGTLTKPKAKELFTKHYPEHLPAEDKLLAQVLEAVGYNTLVIELLAKNLSNFNDGLESTYSLASLLTDLSKGGLFGIKTEAVQTIYHAGQAPESQDLQMRQETPETILEAMYVLNELPELERQLLSVFAILPAEAIPYQNLKALLPAIEELNKPLLALAHKGWLEFDKTAKTLKVSPVIQEITRKKNEKRLEEDCKALLDSLFDLLKPDVIHEDNYAHSTVYARYAASLIQYWERPYFSLGTLCGQLGGFYTDTGNLSLALDNYQKYYLIFQELYQSDNNNSDFKNGLAISYSKLGETHSSLGNLEKALEFFEDETVLFEELYSDYPQNVSFKNGLALSYQFLGITHSSLGNLEKALNYFEYYNKFEFELHNEYPNNVAFKNLLAISYSKLGETHSSLGNLDKALEFFENYNTLKSALYDSYPQNVSFKNGLAISYEKLGSTHSSLGNLEKALEFFEPSSQLVKELYEAYPQNVEFKNNLAISYSKLGETHSSLGNLDKALENYEKDLHLTKELYEAYPQNVSFKNGLALSYQWLGWHLENKMGQKEKAIPYYQKSKKLLIELTTSFPTYQAFQNNLAWVENKLKALE